MIEVLLAVSLLGIVLVLARFLLRPAAPPVVAITVAAGRQITVNGQSFPEVPLDEDESFDPEFKKLIRPGGEIELAIVPAPGAAAVQVKLQRRGAKTLNIDASHATQLVVYGGYDRAPRSRTGAVVEKCIWCKGGIIVCGISPQCP